MGGVFVDDPQTEAIIRSTLGNAYVRLSEVNEAMPHLERALELITEKAAKGGKKAQGP